MRTTTNPLTPVALLVTAALGLAACGGSTPSPAPAPAPSPAGAPPVAAAPAAPSAPSVVASVSNVSPAEAEKWLQEHPDTVILDVRTPGEFAAGHLQGGLLLDYNSPDFADKLTSLDRTKTYLVHCKSGRRSAGARDAMIENGFQSIIHLEGGIEAWQAAGKPVVQ